MEFIKQNAGTLKIIQNQSPKSAKSQFLRTSSQICARKAQDRNEFERAISGLSAFSLDAKSALVISGFVECAILLFKTLTDIVKARTNQRRRISRRRVVSVVDGQNDLAEIKARRPILRNSRPVSSSECEFIAVDFETFRHGRNYARTRSRDFSSR